MTRRVCLVKLCLVLGDIYQVLFSFLRNFCLGGDVVVKKPRPRDDDVAEVGYTRRHLFINWHSLAFVYQLASTIFIEIYLKMFGTNIPSEMDPQLDSIASAVENDGNTGTNLMQRLSRAANVRKLLMVLYSVMISLRHKQAIRGVNTLKESAHKSLVGFEIKVLKPLFPSKGTLSTDLLRHWAGCGTFPITEAGLPTCLHQKKLDLVPQNARKSQIAVLRH